MIFRNNCISPQGFLYNIGIFESDTEYLNWNQVPQWLQSYEGVIYLHRVGLDLRIVGVDGPDTSDPSWVTRINYGFEGFTISFDPGDHSIVLAQKNGVGVETPISCICTDEIKLTVTTLPEIIVDSSAYIRSVNEDLEVPAYITDTQDPAVTYARNEASDVPEASHPYAWFNEDAGSTYTDSATPSAGDSIYNSSDEQAVLISMVSSLTPAVPYYAWSDGADTYYTLSETPEAGDNVYDSSLEESGTVESYNAYIFKKWSDGSTDNPRTFHPSKSLSLTVEVALPTE